MISASRLSALRRATALAPQIDSTSYRSPNSSPRTQAIRAVVLHSGDGTKSSDLGWLCNPASRVSAHYYIDRAGRVYQLVPDERVAWHAGVASYGGITDWNSISLGIEQEHTVGIHHDYTVAQRASLRELLLAKIAQYSIAAGFIVSHRAIAMPRGRKEDPLDWPEADLRGWINALYQQSAHYRVRGAAIHEGPGLGFPVALNGQGYLRSGEDVSVDEIKPGGWGHLADGRGFVLLNQMERV